MLPELDVGDWLYYEDMGAYTLSMATIFNGLDATAIKYHCLEELCGDETSTIVILIEMNVLLTFLSKRAFTEQILKQYFGKLDTVNTMKKRLTDRCVVDLHPERRSTHEIIQNVVSEKQRKGDDDRFVVCDVGDIIQKFQHWVTLMPRIKLFYAVKCNTDEALLQVLSDMGASFDCASKKEIEAVLNLGVSPTRIVYAHPCKPVSSLNFAKSRDVSLMTFDNVNELQKVKETYPSARLLLRLLPEKEFNARLEFSGRYGCSSTEVRYILQTAKDLELNIFGVSFHVGSDIQDPRAYVSILQQSRSVFDIARRMGFNMNILDIGGGFPGEQNTFERFKEITEVINKTLLDLFLPEDNVEIIAEPGRYIAASAFTVVASIMSKRCYQSSADGDVNGQDSAQLKRNVATYFLNDSVFGNFMYGRLYMPGSVIHIPKVVKVRVLFS
ncbi:probable ornithine decarboxylase [Mercenaria mercenaria]|uniref:probable ornithine decarboxylase n=1 Tax=Mercenaria mercenaria TaxID=6596 RepID=UPI00234F9082|nr:probable ornithine decarboxylase [Mercenaria mercenaria]